MLEKIFKKKTQNLKEHTYCGTNIPQNFDKYRFMYGNYFAFVIFSTQIFLLVINMKELEWGKLE